MQANGLASEDRAPPAGRSGRRGREEEFARLLGSVVAPAFGILPGTLRERSRGCAGVAFARQVAIYLAHTRLGLSYTDAGGCFRRDRTTARHACRRVEDRREDVRLDTLLDCLERSIDLMPHSAGEGRESR